MSPRPDPANPTPRSGPNDSAGSVARRLIVQHAEPDAPYAIDGALSVAGVEVDLRRTDLGDPLPLDCSTHDAMVVLGGPMSAASDLGYPTRQAELALIDSTLRRGIPTLGICLGAQMIAAALGAEVSPGASGPEVGWSPVDFSADARDDPLFSGVPGRSTVLHWHGDSFTLPVGATALASSAKYANQAFSYGDRVWGLQFHLEVVTGAVERFTTAFPDDLAGVPGGAARIEDATPDALELLGPLRDLVLARFASLVSKRLPRALADH